MAKETTKRSNSTASNGSKEGPLCVYVGREQSATKNTMLLRDADGKLEEYLRKNGIYVQPEQNPGAPRENAEIRMRQMYHKNMKVLLGIYRELRATYMLFRQEFADRIDAASGTPLSDIVGETAENYHRIKIENDTTGMFFDRISHELDFMSASDETKFRKIWVPQIAVGRKIEYALYAVDFGLKVLNAQDRKHYELLNYVYIEGDKRPSVRATMSRFDFMSPSSYYKHIDEANTKLTALVFSFVSDQAELNSILAYLEHLHNMGLESSCCSN